MQVVQSVRLSPLSRSRGLRRMDATFAVKIVLGFALSWVLSLGGFVGGRGPGLLQTRVFAQSPAGGPAVAAPTAPAPAVPTPATQGPTALISTLEQAEVAFYGKAEQGPFLPRIERLEADLFGGLSGGPGEILTRVLRINSYLLTGTLTGLSLSTRIAALEWRLTGASLGPGPLLNRLRALEEQLFGAPGSGPVDGRVQQIAQLLWPGGRMEMQTAQLPAGATLVQVQLLEPVSSASTQLGARVAYEVTESLVVDGVLVIPAGARATATVTEVERAGSFGRNGKLRMNFGSVTAIDGSPVFLAAGAQAVEANRSLETAAAATMAGMLLLGPPGALGGFLVQGKDVEIPAEEPFYLEVQYAASVRGLVLGSP